VALRWRAQTNNLSFGSARTLFRGFGSLPPGAAPDAVRRSTMNHSGDDVIPWFKLPPPAQAKNKQKTTVMTTFGDGSGRFCQSEPVVSENKRHEGVQAGITDDRTPV